MKKILAFIAILILAISTSGYNSFAADTTTLTLADSIAAPDGVVGVSVKMSKNQGLWGMMFSVSFNAEYFEFSEVRNNNDVFSNDAYMIGPRDFSEGKVNVLITPSDLQNNNIKNGSVCTIFFKVASNTPDGEYSLDLTVSEKDVCDVNRNKVEITPVSGKITVDKNYKPKTTQNTAKAGEVIATTSNENSKKPSAKGKTTTKHFENMTEINTVYVTDKNGEAVTDKNGKKVTKKVIVDKDSGQVIGDEDGEKFESKNGKNGLEFSVIILIVIFACIVFGCIIVAIVTSVKKKQFRK